MPATVQPISGGLSQVTVTFNVKGTELMGEVNLADVAEKHLLAEVANVAVALDDGVRAQAELINATQG